MRHHPHLFILAEGALGLCLFTKQGRLLPIVVKTTLINPRGRLLKYHHIIWFDQSTKGDLVLYKTRHDQSTKGDLIYIIITQL
jgi:hypothetical protein